EEDGMYCFSLIRRLPEKSSLGRLSTTMRNLFLFFALAFVIFSSSNALAATEHGMQLEVPQSELDQDVQWRVAEKRILRANNDVNTDGEERGITELAAKMKTWTQSLKTSVASSKPIQTVALKQRIAKVKRMIKKGVSDTVLVENKVTPDEFFVALKLNPELKQSYVRNNPALNKYRAYKRFYESKIVVT
ncbi:hypothetical protein F441_00244, partial [Phytophthora nicotianae CJ01A1]